MLIAWYIKNYHEGLYTPIKVPVYNIFSSSIVTEIDNGLRIVPMKGKTFGADVYGFDPRVALDNEYVQNTILNAAEKHLVLVFHNVSDNLTPETHLKLSKTFGPVNPGTSSPPSYLSKGRINSPDQVAFAEERGVDMSALGNSMRLAAMESTLPKEVTRIVKNKGDIFAFGEGWHTDLSFYSGTPFLALLVSRDLPPVGKGNTLFSDMRHAYETLSEETKARIENLSANHTDGADMWHVHPVVRHDNKFGAKSLFVNKAFTRTIAYPSTDSSDTTQELLNSLLKHIDELPARSPQAFLDISWSPGQMVVWDNRYTQHAAQANYAERREMHRVIVSGTVPF